MPVRQRFRTRQGLPALVLATAAAPCLAQESTNVPAATQPSVGRFYLREKLQYISFGDDPSPADRDIDKFALTSSLSYGISRTISATLDVPLVLSSTSSQPEDDRDDFFGVYDLSLSLKSGASGKRTSAPSIPSASPPSAASRSRHTTKTTPANRGIRTRA